MIIRCELIQRRDEITAEEFRDYWLDIHGPLAAQLPRLKRYEQHIVTDNTYRHPLGSGLIIIDGYSEMSYESYGDMVASVNSEEHAEMQESLSKIAKPFRPVLVTVKRITKEAPAYLDNDDLVTRISFVSRKDGVTDAQFQREWWCVHDKLVGTVPGPAGYHQNLVIDRIIDGKPVPYGELPVEGIVEFFFANKTAFKECNDSPEFARTAKHGGEFVGSISPYLTKTIRYL